MHGCHSSPKIYSGINRHNLTNMKSSGTEVGISLRHKTDRISVPITDNFRRLMEQSKSGNSMWRQRMTDLLLTFNDPLEFPESG